MTADLILKKAAKNIPPPGFRIIFARAIMQVVCYAR